MIRLANTERRPARRRSSTAANRIPNTERMTGNPTAASSGEFCDSASTPLCNSDQTCQLCGQGALEKFEVTGSSIFWLCRACELYQFGEWVDQEAYSATYHAGYEKRRRQKCRTARIRLSRLMKSLQTRHPRMLEVGSSVGSTLEAAEQLGWDAVGVDVSEETVSRCRARGLDCRHVGPLELPFENDSFDVLVSFHVIEHVANVDETLKEWSRVLKPGGLMLLETPDASSPKVRRLGSAYRKFWAPEHTYTFTPSNLSQFVTRCGLETLVCPRFSFAKRPKWDDLTYAPLYQLYLEMRRWVGVHKAFQLLARKQGSSS